MMSRAPSISPKYIGRSESFRPRGKNGQAAAFEGLSYASSLFLLKQQTVLLLFFSASHSPYSVRHPPDLNEIVAQNIHRYGCLVTIGIIFIYYHLQKIGLLKLAAVYIFVIKMLILNK